MNDYTCLGCKGRIFDDRGLETYIKLGHDPRKVTLCEKCKSRIWGSLDTMIDIYGPGFRQIYDEWENEWMDHQKNGGR